MALSFGGPVFNGGSPQQPINPLLQLLARFRGPSAVPVDVSHGFRAPTPPRPVDGGYGLPPRPVDIPPSQLGGGIPLRGEQMPPPGYHEGVTSPGASQLALLGEHMPSSSPFEEQLRILNHPAVQKLLMRALGSVRPESASSRAVHAARASLGAHTHNRLPNY